MTAEPTRKRAIGQILLLAAGFLVLVAISSASVILVNEARKDNGLVVHTVEVENQISTVLLEVRRAESAARGYLLTSETRFLAEHETAVAAIIPDVEKLVALIGDNPIQIQASKELRPAIDAFGQRCCGDRERKSSTEAGFSQIRGADSRSGKRFEM